MSPQKSDALVFFGASGDLAKKQIFPALYGMVANDELDVPVIGVAFSQWTLADLKKRATESVKAASDVYAPVAGEVSAVNGDLENAPELVNQNPYEEGWFFKLKNVNKAEYDALMNAAAYAAFIEEERAK